MSAHAKSALLINNIPRSLSSALINPYKGRIWSQIWIQGWIWGQIWGQIWVQIQLVKVGPGPNGTVDG